MSAKGTSHGRVSGNCSSTLASNPQAGRSVSCSDPIFTKGGDLEPATIGTSNLEPGLIGQVAAQAFDLDPARTTVPPFDGLHLPHLRAAMWAVDAEMTAGGAGGRLAAESMANVLAVHLIRHILAPHQPRRGRDGDSRRGGSAPSSSTSRSTSTPTVKSYQESDRRPLY